jgi:hypothetical protein
VLVPPLRYAPFIRPDSRGGRQGERDPRHRATLAADAARRLQGRPDDRLPQQAPGRNNRVGHCPANTREPFFFAFSWQQR